MEKTQANAEWIMRDIVFGQIVKDGVEHLIDTKVQFGNTMKVAYTQEKVRNARRACKKQDQDRLAMLASLQDYEFRKKSKLEKVNAMV